MSLARPSFVSKNRHPASGFTLLELLVTIGIIGILIALVLVAVPKVKRAVYQAETQAQLSAIANAIQQYYNDYKSYPGPMANIQLYTTYDGSPTPYIVSTTYPLKGTSGTSGTNTMAATADATGLDPTHITGAENLVLGLCGGLRATTTSAGVLTAFEYHPEDLFAYDGVTPNVHGPPSLSVASPRRQTAYIQVKPGDLSVPNNTINSGQFTDSANRAATDSMIPEFMDKYSDPLPILYYRTNVGGTAIVGFRNYASPSIYYVNDAATKLNATPQYDLTHNLAYTKSAIGTNAGSSNSIHGLGGITFPSNQAKGLLVSSAPPAPVPPVDTIDYTQSGQLVPTNSGQNGLAYFKDPSLNSTVYDNSTSNTNLGVARQKDGFILISAGPDRLYGTSDDNVYPGPLLPPSN